MKRSKEEFWGSTFTQIVQMIDMYLDEKQLQAATMNNESYDSRYFKPKENVRDVTSLKDFESWW